MNLNYQEYKTILDKLIVHSNGIIGLDTSLLLVGAVHLDFQLLLEILHVILCSFHTSC